jgi:hypothetical protein
MFRKMKIFPNKKGGSKAAKFEKFSIVRKIENKNVMFPK